MRNEKKKLKKTLGGKIRRKCINKERKRSETKQEEK